MLLSTLLLTRSMEEYFSTRFLASVSEIPSSFTSMAITFSGSVI